MSNDWRMPEYQMADFASASGRRPEPPSSTHAGRWPPPGLTPGRRGLEPELTPPLAARLTSPRKLRARSCFMFESLKMD
jgi:hypothetical protein